jgi:hypothetical protein
MGTAYHKIDNTHILRWWISRNEAASESKEIVVIGVEDRLQDK